jgi:hypothetical protein
VTPPGEAKPNDGVKPGKPSAGWLHSPSAKAEIKQHIKTANDKEAAISAADAKCLETPDELAKLPVIYRWSTTKNAYTLSKSDHARLPKCPVADKDLPRVPKWRRHLTDIARHVVQSPKFAPHGARFLRDVIFWHHQSTDGRWNDKIKRWDRYGVRQLEDWRAPSSSTPMDEMMSTSTFVRFKNRLIEVGLIVAEAHLAGGKTRLWAKPTEKLQRIVFEPDYWASIKADFKAPVAPAKPKSKNKPRGLSALHAKVSAESEVLYKKAIAGGFNKATTDERWQVWNRLTKSVALTNGKMKQPFTTKGDHRYNLLRERLIEWC